MDRSHLQENPVGLLLLQRPGTRPLVQAALVADPGHTDIQVVQPGQPQQPVNKALALGTAIANL